ncbi:BRO family protein, partial [Clostridium neonatale]|uniref:BRO family protein n=1 Tax=Clostridium neonatale TaxID=137838 RepID=UPI00397AE6B5
MNNQLQIFKNDEFGQVRGVLINGESYLIGKDVAEKLGYSNTPKAIRDHVDDDDKLTERIVLSGQNREVIVINESGLYSLILSSKLPNAKKFKRWVTSEVLPQIRKTGGYIPINEEDSEKDILAKAVLIANKTIEQKDAKIIELSSKNNELEEKIEDDKHKVSFAEAVENSDDVILVKEMATIITQNGFKIGQNQLF